MRTQCAAGKFAIYYFINAHFRSAQRAAPASVTFDSKRRVHHHVKKNGQNDRRTVDTLTGSYTVGS